MLRSLKLIQSSRLEKFPGNRYSRESYQETIKWQSIMNLESPSFPLNRLDIR